jgi:hypothetical protein
VGHPDRQGLDCCSTSRDASTVLIGSISCLDWTTELAGAKLAIYMAEQADIEASRAFGWEDAGAILRAYETVETGRFEAIPVFER